VHESALDLLGLPGAAPGNDVRELPGLLGELGELRPRSWPPRDWSCVYWYTDGAAGGLELHVPAWYSRRQGPGPFSGLESGEALAAAVTAFHVATGGLPWRGAGSVTSDAWLRRGAVAAALPAPMLAGEVHETQLVWGRAPRPDEGSFRYCHGLDGTGAFLAVAGSLELPTGEPTLVDWPTFDKRLPGIWHVELERSPAGLLPPITSDVEGLVWVTTPTMELLHARGVRALEAYLWEGHGRHLRRWQEQLRDARAALLADGAWSSPAGAAVKAIYQQGLGRLASVKRAADPPTRDPLYQPYSDLAVIAEARARLVRRVLQVAEPGGGCQRVDGAVVCGPHTKGTTPLAVYRDAVFYLSSRATPAKLGDALGLRMGDGLGAWKAVGTCAGAAARDLMASPRGSMANTVKLLAGLVKGER
jgi:hypothetical protein